jgi:hypothetical protein
VAHRSGQLDGIETTEPVVVDGFWRSTCSVYRKDMGHAFTYGGRYPTTGGNQKFAPEMAVKVGEVMALRRAFDVSAPVLEERWDVELPEVEPVVKPTLAERAAAKAAEVTTVRIEEQPYQVFQATNAYPPEQPIPDANEDATPTVSVGLSVETLKDLCVKNAKSTVKIAKAIGCEPDQVGARVKSMSPVERGVLADELGIDWRGAW